MSYKNAGEQLPAKSIVFAITLKHALSLEESFNEIYPEHKGLLAKFEKNHCHALLHLRQKKESEQELESLFHSLLQKFFG
ncbi:MAG: hypothetical protein QM725_11545 [Lacibacter sp.]